LQHFLLLCFAKLWNASPNYGIEKKSRQFLDICFAMADWPKARSSWVSTKVLQKKKLIKKHPF
jgi:hypothetical protein